MKFVWDLFLICVHAQPIAMTAANIPMFIGKT